MAFTDNPGLKPERSRSAELGVAQVWLGGALQARRHGFLNNYDDLIVAVGQLVFRGQPLAHRQHLERASARARGLDRPGGRRPALGLQATYTLLVDGDSRRG